MPSTNRPPDSAWTLAAAEAAAAGCRVTVLVTAVASRSDDVAAAAIASGDVRVA